MPLAKDSSSLTDSPIEWVDNSAGSGTDTAAAAGTRPAHLTAVIKGGGNSSGVGMMVLQPQENAGMRYNAFAFDNSKLGSGAVWWQVGVRVQGIGGNENWLGVGGDGTLSDPPPLQFDPDRRRAYIGWTHGEQAEDGAMAGFNALMLGGHLWLDANGMGGEPANIRFADGSWQTKAATPPSVAGSWNGTMPSSVGAALDRLAAWVAAQGGTKP